MNATMPQPQTLPSLSSLSVPTAAREPGVVGGAPLVLLRLEGAAALAGAMGAYSVLGGGWGMFALLFLLPDLAMLGYLAGRRVGAACYNAVHSYVWAAHIGFDRLLGYGLKYGTGFGDSHLGRRGVRQPR